jgi:hypothetical protein
MLILAALVAPVGLGLIVGLLAPPDLTERPHAWAQARTAQPVDVATG